MPLGIVGIFFPKNFLVAADGPPPCASCGRLEGPNVMPNRAPSQVVAFFANHPLYLTRIFYILATSFGVSASQT